MLSNAHFLGKFRFDTAENEPAKNLQIFEKCIFRKCIFEMLGTAPCRRRRAGTGARSPSCSRPARQKFCNVWQNVPPPGKFNDTALRLRESNILHIILPEMVQLF